MRANNKELDKLTKCKKRADQESDSGFAEK